MKIYNDFIEQTFKFTMSFKKLYLTNDKVGNGSFHPSQAHSPNQEVRRLYDYGEIVKSERKCFTAASGQRVHLNYGVNSISFEKHA